MTPGASSSNLGTTGNIGTEGSGEDSEEIINQTLSIVGSTKDLIDDPNVRNGGAFLTDLAEVAKFLPPPAGSIAAGAFTIAGTLMSIFGVE